VREITNYGFFSAIVKAYFSGMQTHQFKKLDVKPEGSWLKRTLKSKRFRKTVIYSLSGALIGYSLFYFVDGRAAGVIWNSAALENVLMGFGFGILLTNSPCSRRKC